MSTKTFIFFLFIFVGITIGCTTGQDAPKKKFNGSESQQSEGESRKDDEKNKEKESKIDENEENDTRNPDGSDQSNNNDNSDESHNTSEKDTPSSQCSKKIPNYQNETIVNDANELQKYNAKYVDLALTTNADVLKRARSYEQLIWEKRQLLKEHVLSQYNESGSDADARDSGYSSKMGLASYHTFDELYSLSFAIDVTGDPSRKEEYAKIGIELLDILVPAVGKGKGTAGCNQTNNIYKCAPGYFRYLDGSRGSSGAGIVMNALYEDPNLRAKYKEKLESYANQLIPAIERLFKYADDTGPDSTPHMAGDFAPGVYAVGKILKKQRYIEAFKRLTTVIAASSNANDDGWPGSDASHARVSAVIANFAYREFMRRNIKTPIEIKHMKDTAVGYVKRTNNGGYLSGDQVVGFGTLVRFEDSLEKRISAPNEYKWTASKGSHKLAEAFESVASIAMGFATRHPDDKDPCSSKGLGNK